MVTEGDEPVDRTFWEGRLKRALDYRRRVVADTDACRLIYGEADGFPGLVVDSYAGHLAIQTLHPGMEQRLPEIMDLLVAHLSPASVTLRHDAEVRHQEGLPLEVRTVYGRAAAPGGSPGGTGQAVGGCQNRPENRALSGPAGKPPGRRGLLPGGSPGRLRLPGGVCHAPGSRGPSGSPWWRARARPWP